MKKLSITTKITLWYGIFLILISVLLVIVLLRYYDFREQSTAEKQLIQTVEDIDDRIATTGKDFAEAPDIDFYTNDTYLSVYEKDGSFIAGLRPEGINGFPDFSFDRTQTFDDENGRQWYVYDTIIYLEDPQEMYIRGIMENTGYEAAPTRLGRFLTIAIPVLIILALVGGLFISRRALSPMRDLISVTNDIRKDADLSRRVPVPESKDETGELTESINGMFDTIEEVVGRERQFTSDVSHELRTPITIIRTQSEYALEDPAYMRKALSTINRESHRMSELITDLLTISRSESGRMHPDMEPVDIGAMLSDLAEQTAMVISDRDIEIRFIDETDGSGLRAKSDENMLMRIILNLLENATRYGKSSGGHIELRMRQEGETAVITVADDGKGIAAAEQSKVWNRFYQTEESRSRKGSSGLGLAIVESLTKALGGSIRIVPDDEKRPGELPGAVFELRLPVFGESGLN